MQTMREPETMACPACPDGNVWTLDGPTQAICPTCGGYAALYRDGSRIDERKHFAQPGDGDADL